MAFRCLTSVLAVFSSLSVPSNWHLTRSWYTNRAVHRAVPFVFLLEESSSDSSGCLMQYERALPVNFKDVHFRQHAAGAIHLHAKI